MWPLCTANNFLWLLIPLLIGFLTGLWAWGRGAAKVVSYPSAALSGAGSGLASAGAAARDTGIRTADTARGYGYKVGETHDAPAASASVEPIRPAATVPAVEAGLTGIGIPAAVGEPDDLQRVKGIGPKLDALLQSLGIRRFDQIAAWGPSEIARVDSHLGAFRGRIERDNWVEQAKLLARGAFDEFEARFGSVGTPEN
jgi:predicted flap endonuclease-1-like 5' DNA nuclease